MASVIKPSDPVKNGSDEEIDPTPEPEVSDSAPGVVRAGTSMPARLGDSGGSNFFHIYKKGQGYWTRMGTAITLAVIAALTSYRLYLSVPTLMPASMSELTANRVGLGVAVGFLVIFTLFAFWITNKPGNVDFLIATDSEMKKVNWTSRRELIGSTRVVILFMFAVTIFLFLMDLLFGELFYLMHVLKNSPFGGAS